MIYKTDLIWVLFLKIQTKKIMKKLFNYKYKIMKIKFKLFKIK